MGNENSLFTETLWRYENDGELLLDFFVRACDERTTIGSLRSVE